MEYFEKLSKEMIEILDKMQPRTNEVLWLLSRAIQINEACKNYSIKQKEIKPKQTKQRIKNKENVFIVACYLSKFGHEQLFPELNQTKALQKIADILSIKFNSFKGTRDIFDPYFDNGRKGWTGRALKEFEEKIYTIYKDKTHEDFIYEVRQILNI